MHIVYFLVYCSSMHFIYFLISLTFIPKSRQLQKLQEDKAYFSDCFMCTKFTKLTMFMYFLLRKKILPLHQRCLFDSFSRSGQLKKMCGQDGQICFCWH